MAIDYRNLNAATRPMLYPLPHMRQVLQGLAGNRYFARMDLRKGFYQVPVSPGAQQLTAFVTASGLYEFTRMPFGVKNGSAHFQMAMDDIMPGR